MPSAIDKKMGVAAKSRLLCRKACVILIGGEILVRLSVRLSDTGRIMAGASPRATGMDRLNLASVMPMRPSTAGAGPAVHFGQSVRPVALTLACSRQVMMT
jgi:hypothetical protein